MDNTNKYGGTRFNHDDHLYFELLSARDRLTLSRKIRDGLVNKEYVKTLYNLTNDELNYIVSVCSHLDTKMDIADQRD